MALLIMAERPDTADAQELIMELDAYLTPMYPSESRHGFSVDKLMREGVAFFVMRYNEELVGCGGVKFFVGDPAECFGEARRMYVRPQFRGKGLAQRMGFRRIGPFGACRLGPLSLYFEQRIV